MARSYYQEQQAAFQWLIRQAETHKAAGIPINADKIIYNATKQFAVSEKALYKRLQKMEVIDRYDIEY